MCQGIVLLYLLFVWIMLICNATNKARVRFEDIKMQRCKYFCLRTPLLLLALICQTYVSIETLMALKYESGWFELLEQSQAMSRDCTNPSLYIDLEKLVSDREDLSGFNGAAKLIFSVSIVNVLLFVLQFLMHLGMLMRWFRENPIKEETKVRSIKVGIAPEDDQSHSPVRSAVSFGQIVPEADRRKSPIPLKLIKRNSIPGIPIRGKDE